MALNGAHSVKKSFVFPSQDWEKEKQYPQPFALGSLV